MKNKKTTLKIDYKTLNKLKKIKRYYGFNSFNTLINLWCDKFSDFEIKMRDIKDD